MVFLLIKIIIFIFIVIPVVIFLLLAAGFLILLPIMAIISPFIGFDPDKDTSDDG